MTVSDIFKAAQRTRAKVFVLDQNIPVRVMDEYSPYWERPVYSIMGFNRKCDNSRNSILLEVR